MQSSSTMRLAVLMALTSGIALLLELNTARAVQRTYTLVQNNSTIAISGNIDGTAITSQGTNNFGQSSLVARYSGTILTDRQSNSINTISFLGGSTVDALVNGTWQPNVGGVSGSASADYGGQTSLSGVDVKMAGRNLIADLITTGAPMNIAAGQFGFSSTNLNLTSGTVDYRGVLLGFIEVLTGSYGLANQGGSLVGTASLSTQSLGGGMLRETIIVPVNAALPPVVVSGYTINLTLTGSLEATSDFADDGLRYWINSAGGTFATNTNWNPSFTPGSTETAVFDLNNTYTVTFSGNATNDRLRVNKGNVTMALGTRTYGLTNTSTSTQSVVVGATSGNSAGLTLSGSGAGGTLNSVNAVLGSVAGSIGQVNVGANSTWNNTSDIYIGGSGAGTLMVTGGGKVLAPATGGGSYIGYAIGSSGTATVSGSASTWNNDYFFVGHQGSGSLTVSSAGLVTSKVGSIGVYATGIATVTGASSTFTNTDVLWVGEHATGTLNIQAGATLNAKTTNLGAYAGSNGTITVTGAGSVWNNSDSVYVGGIFSASGNTGTLNISSSGTVNVTNTLKTYSLGNINLSGGKLKAGTLNISTGTFSQTGGQLAVASVTGNLNRAGGSLTPGDSLAAGLTAITGNYTQQAAASLAIELGGLTPGTQFDRLTSTGSASLAGSLSVSLINSFMPAWNNSFEILSATGGRSGSFASPSLPALSNSNLEWLVNYSANALTLSVGLIGDFNSNGIVDAADYVVWRKNNGSAAQYNAWRSHFGAVASGSGSSLGSGSAVPEPASGLLVSLALVAMSLRNRRRGE